MTEQLKREFAKRKPWVTKFTIEGHDYGGQYDAARDGRLVWFQQQFPQAQRVLELGSLEGGHSFEVASWPHISQVVAIEGRPANLTRARFVQTRLNQPKVTFVHGNLEKIDLPSLGQFDAVLCLGLLYHLPEPWRLIEQISRVTTGLFLWTHYAELERATTQRQHYPGRLYREWFFSFESLSGLSPASFWPTQAALLQMLADYGFGQTTILEDDAGQRHGPAITLAARRT